MWALGWLICIRRAGCELLTLFKLDSPWESFQGQQDPKHQSIHPARSREGGGCLAKLCLLEQTRGLAWDCESSRGMNALEAGGP